MRARSEQETDEFLSSQVRLSPHSNRSHIRNKRKCTLSDIKLYVRVERTRSCFGSFPVRHRRATSTCKYAFRNGFHVREACSRETRKFRVNNKQTNKLCNNAQYLYSSWSRRILVIRASPFRHESAFHERF